jgi:Bacteriophage related domain of unknown function
MAGNAVVTAVAALLAANWLENEIVEDDTTGQGPADGSPYVTVEYPVAREDQITIGSPGNNIFRETGVIRVVMSFPTGTGLPQVTTLMDQLRAIFRGKQFDGVTTFAPSPAVIDPTNYQGGRFKVSSACPYYFDLFA